MLKLLYYYISRFMLLMVVGRSSTNNIENMGNMNGAVRNYIWAIKRNGKRKLLAGGYPG